MKSKHTHGENVGDTRHYPAAILSSEKHLWSAILDNLDSNPNQLIVEIYRSIEENESASMLCPICKNKLLVNTNTELWKSQAEPDGVAVISTLRLEDSVGGYYLAIRFDGQGLRVAQLPKWTDSNP